MLSLPSLHDALSHHGLGNLEEAGYVGTLDIVDVAVGLGAILHAVVVNVVHDVMKLGINLFTAPAQTLRVLAHLKTRHSHAAGVGSLAR